MRFLLDESAEFRIAGFLREAGHDVMAIAHDYPFGLPDHQVLALAVAERRILITNDRDFGELIVRQHLPHCGVIFLRLGLSSTSTSKIERLARLLVSHGDRLDQFLVVTAQSVRVHGESQ